MSFKELFTDSVLSIIDFTFKVYLKIASTVLWIILPLFKDKIAKRLKNIQVTNDQFYIRIILEKETGLYESYVNGDWTTKDLVTFFTKVLNYKNHALHYLHPLTWTLSYFNLQTRKRAWQVGEAHYDIGNDIYEAMLDTNLQYTCGYWKTAKNLEEAQLAKMELIAQKLKLKPGMKVLDMGCGFGTLAYYLAKNHGVSVVGCSISKEQIKYGKKICKGLPVDLRLCDYRDMDGQFDRVVSIGLIEHVGKHNYKEFFQLIHRCLKDNGLFLLHGIGNHQNKVLSANIWLHRYIFPNGMIPKAIDLCKAMGDKWVIEDWHNFGLDYSKTLAAWEINFDRAWPKLSMKYGERFYRMWKLYLSISQAVFLTRALQLWQIVLSKNGLEDGYLSVR